MLLERFKNQKFSHPGEGNTPSPRPHTPYILGRASAAEPPGKKMIFNKGGGMIEFYNIYPCIWRNCFQ